MSAPGPLTWFFLALFLLALGAAFLYFVFCPVVLVPQGEAVVVERLGLFNRVLSAGWRWLWPWERVRHVEWRYSVEGRTPLGVACVQTETFRHWRLPISECTLQLPASSCTLSDGRSLSAGLTLDYDVVDVKRAAYVQDLFLRLEGQMRSELQAAARSLEEGARLDAPELERVLRSRLGTLKWAEKHGLRLSGCTLNGFALTGTPHTTQPQRAHALLGNEGDLAQLGAEHKLDEALLGHELALQSKRESAQHAAMAAELQLLEAAAKGGLANDVLIAYLRLRKGNAGEQ